MKLSKALGKTVTYIFLVLLLALAFFPIVYTFFSSFKTNSEIMAYPERFFPGQWTLDNYKLCWESEEFPVPRLMINSIIYSAWSVAVIAVISSLVAYVFERGNFKGKQRVFTIMTALMFISLGPIATYADFKVLNFVHIPISLYGLMFKMMFAIPLVNIYLIKGYIQGIPRELDEAAMIDGYGFVRIFTNIILPLLRPIIVTVVILTFQSSWNAYLSPAMFTMSHPEQRTLMVGLLALKSTGEAASSWNLMLAGSMISMLPVIILFIFANKYFVSGLMNGAVKG